MLILVVDGNDTREPFRFTYDTLLVHCLKGDNSTDFVFEVNNPHLTARNLGGQVSGKLATGSDRLRCLRCSAPH